ncbi:MAG: hypothetical protein J6T44_11900 [Prevotella sp.]|nr:hypothetical protein [Prevotella sp.]
MKRMKYTVYVAAWLCFIGLFAACAPDEKDNPASPDDQEAVVNRQVLISHIENDAQLVADNLSTESLNASSQAFAQLLEMIELDQRFIVNMRTVLAAIAQKKALAGISPVMAGSELAKMGYLAYITADNSNFGVRVILDGKGGSRLLSADHQEFIFPATVDGIGTTLFKVIVKNSNDYYQTVSDANIPNVNRLACINRLPKSFTMTLTGLIDNKEQTLSESVVKLELPESTESEYVSLDARSFRITGKQSSYLNAQNESTLDFSLSMEDDNMVLDYSFTCDGENIVNNNAQMVLPKESSFTGQMSMDALNVADLKAFTIRILNDLTLTGAVADGASFATNFVNVIKNRQSVDSADALYELVESLNSSCSLQLSAGQMKPETVKFCLVQKDNLYAIEPGLKDLDSDDYIPVSQLVDSQVMEQFNKPFSQSFIPTGNSASSILRFYSVFMRMMPLMEEK